MSFPFAALRVSVVVVLLFALGADGFAQAPDPRNPIAFVGPLTGDFGRLGQRAFQAVTLAANDHGGIRVEAFDTHELGAAEAYGAAANAGVSAIVGPIGEEESAEVIAAMRDGGPPVFLLSGVAGIESSRADVFRLRTSPGDQAAALAAAMFGEGDSPSFAVLAPDDGYGTEAMLAFVRTTVAYGGRVVRVARYESDEPDVTDAVATLVGQRAVRLSVPSNPWRSAPSSRAVSRGGDRTRPDGVFVPDFGRQVSAILPHLQFHGWLAETESDSVGLLGISGWASEGLSSAGDLAANAYVVQVFNAEDPASFAEAFALEWTVRFDEPPTAFEAQAFDAAGFVAFVLDQAASQDPAAVVDAAMHVYEYGGVCGNMWLGDDGGVLRQLGLWQVDGVGALYPLGTVEPPSAERQ